MPAPPPARPPAPEVAAASAPAGAADQVLVKPGDTLTRIANRTQRPGVSLDQMLVSLFRGNPLAFADDNMNRLRSGAVLSVPSAEQAQRVAPAEARALIIAQSADFDAYRQRLASGAPAAAGTGSARTATGRVQAQVDDRRQAAASSPDKLTLSQGAVKAPTPEDRVSRQAESREAAARLAELSRNVDELRKLQGAAGLVATVPAASAPGAGAAVSAMAPAAPSAPATVAVTRGPAPAPAPASEAGSGVLDTLLSNPLTLPGAGLLVLLLAGLGVYRLRGKAAPSASETSFIESRMQPDSFFGAAGGQRIDTREAVSTGPVTGSSTTYSLSQLDAIGDVDPVAEADVYLAYGRDLQAEEILKEAMRTNPERMAIRTKLLEVYAKRRDGKAFELLAGQVYALTDGQGDDWATAQQMGRQLDPDNPLYRPGGRPQMGNDSLLRVADTGYVPTMPAPARVAPGEPSATLPPSQPGPIDLDLDMDLAAAGSAPGASAPAAPEAPMLEFQMSVPAESQPDVTNRMPMPMPAGPGQAAAGPGASNGPDSGLGPLDFDLSDLPLDAAAPSPARSAPDTLEASLDFAGFDLPEPAAEPSVLDDDPLTRKLELAEEFRQIGDLEGARDLLEEVLAKAEGALKARAQGLLDRLG